MEITETQTRIRYTNHGTYTPAQVAKDIDFILEWVDKQHFECDCNAFMESDTGAWIHEEDKCSAFMEDHIDIVLHSLRDHFRALAESEAK